MPLISYIIPAYNVPAAMLVECVESILAVSLDDDEREIIVVDDGSQVPCADVLSNYAGRLTVVRQDNQGASVARNTGIEHAHGEYIHFVDADDMLVREPYDECIEQVKVLRPDLLAFDFAVAVHDAATGVFRVFDTGAEYMLSRNLHTGTCSYIVRAALLDGLRFVPQLKHEDERFTTLLYIKAGKTVVTDARAYYYRQHEGSLQHANDAESVACRLADYASTLFMFNVMTFDTERQRLAMRRRVSQMVMDYIYNTITLTRSKAKLGEVLDGLRANGLFPMPHACYTAKYFVFSYLANNAFGRQLLLWLLPLLPKEV